jgi:hypothetical protein
MEIITIEGWIVPMGIINTGEIEIPEKFSTIRKAAEIIEKYFFPKMAVGFLFRGTGFGNFGNILASGIDVVPTNAPAFFSADLEKALEYGWPSHPDEKMKTIILCYKSSGLESSFIEKPMPVSEDDLAELLIKYPTVLYTVDEKYAWFSKFPEDDYRTDSGYEFNFGYYMPGDPFDSLKMIFFVGDFSKGEIDFMKIRVNAFKLNSGNSNERNY